VLPSSTLFQPNSHMGPSIWGEVCAYVDLFNSHYLGTGVTTQRETMCFGINGQFVHARYVHLLAIWVLGHVMEGKHLLWGIIR